MQLQKLVFFPDWLGLLCGERPHPVEVLVVKLLSVFCAKCQQYALQNVF